MEQRESSEDSLRGRVIRPNIRETRLERDLIRRAHDRVPTMAFIPVNESQRREERRRRRTFIREQVMNGQQQTEEEEQIADLMDSAAAALLGEYSPDNSNTTILETLSRREMLVTLTTTEGATLSSFSRLIASVILQTVAESFQYTNFMQQHTNQMQQVTIHLSPEMVGRMEPDQSEDMFMRFMRLPAFVRSTSVNADGEILPITDQNTDITNISIVPIVLYGQRTSIDANERQGTRSSARIRERIAREQPTSLQRRWTVYIVNGSNSLLSETPSHDELLNLTSMIGPESRPTVSQETIDNYLPIVKYTQKVKPTIVGNSEKCQVCLNSYQSKELIRILCCHHGFHKDCIDEWLTQGQNKCPLCRVEVIPPSIIR